MADKVPTIEEVVKMGQEHAAREEQAREERAARSQQGPRVALGIGIGATVVGGAIALWRRYHRDAGRGET